MSKFFATCALMALTLASPAIAAFKPGNAISDTNPQPVKVPGSTSIVTASTILFANTYQQVFAADPDRKGCIIQNKSVNVQRIFLGAPGSATDSTSIDLPAGQIFSCTSAGGMVILDQISINSATQGSAFLAIRQ